MFDSSKPYTFDRVIRMILGAAVAFGLFLLLRYLSDVLVPFAAAASLAYILNPLVTEIERRLGARHPAGTEGTGVLGLIDGMLEFLRNRKRGFAVLFTLLGFGIVGFAVIVLMVPLMVHQVQGFENDLDRLKADLAASLLAQPMPGDPDSPVTTQPTSAPAADASWGGLNRAWEAWTIYLQSADRLSRAKRLENLQRHVDGTPIGTLIQAGFDYIHSTEFRAALMEMARRLAVGGFTVFNFALQLVLGATVILVILLYLVFLLLDFPSYRRTWRTFLPPTYRDNILGFLEEFEAVLRRYFRGQFIIASLTGIMFAIAFSIIGLPMAIPFGLFVGVLNMVPYLQTVALIPAALLAVLRSVSGDSSLAESFMWVGVVFVVVQILQDAVITPRIMGKATGLSPIAILLGMFIWGKLLGFLGLLLAIPLTCLGIAYYRRFILKHSEQETSLVQEPE